MDSQLIKSINEYVSKYVDRNAPKLSLENVISIILYCDYSHLSTDFSAAHRKASPFETLTQKNHRHAKYSWWGYYLHNAVNGHGISYDKGSLTGPFFTGMSFKMIVPQFKIRLYSPTSTSVHIEVAMKFSGQQGIILEFHNNYGYSEKVKAFDVSSISRYPEEDERYSCLFLYSVLLFLSFILSFYML